MPTSDEATWILVHSPFLHAGFWEATADALQDRTRGPVRVPSLDVDRGQPGSFYGTLTTQVLGDLPPHAPVRLAVHSNAGLLVPSIVAARSGPTAVVFVDAALPHPGRSWLDDAPPSLVLHLESAGSGGRLPPWPRWWGETRPRLIPDRGLERRLYDRCPSTPWAYLEERVPTEFAWLRSHLAYLQVSEAYEAEANEAEHLGWAVGRLALHHLAIVTDGDAVAEKLVALGGR